MIHFTPLRTRRLAVRFREISIQDAIKLASIPTEKAEHETSEFLRCVIEEAATPSVIHQKDPRAWTVQERTFAVCHYLATVSEEGGNFSVGEGTYSDYLLPMSDYPRVDVVECGLISDVAWRMKPLLGAEAEMIEALQFERPEASYFHWITGAMAAQLRMATDPAPSAIDQFAEYRLWLKDRIEEFARLPESEFTELMRAWIEGQAKLQHFFSMDFNGNGALALPVGGAAGKLPAARFRAAACCSEIALRLGGKPARVGL